MCDANNSVGPLAEKLKQERNLPQPQESHEFSETIINFAGPPSTGDPDQEILVQSPVSLSKSQLKKLRKLEEWEAKKKLKRLKEREKYKQKKQDARAQGLPPTRIGPSRRELKRNKVEESTNSLKIVIDLDFDDLMIDKDVAKCVKQLLRVYTINRRSSSPAKLLFAGIKHEGRIHNTLKKNNGYHNWDVTWRYEQYSNFLPKENLVYLTSDSPDVLETLDHKTYYVIGGLVDHNHHKGICYKRASELGLRTAKLPLSEHIEMKTRTVLSIVHVFEILLKISNGISWTEAIVSVLPMRKGAKILHTSENEDVEPKNEVEDQRIDNEESIEIQNGN